MQENRHLGPLACAEIIDSLKLRLPRLIIKAEMCQGRGFLFFYNHKDYEISGKILIL